ncbi:hypothetical protein FZEAL_5875 [Fusarium zealandicum]|uniref:Uncharacterized protein n=1 Tax=Fusarium zealandicum TaxID=1053134 RepID=A0A8H4XJE6_9HYPO|nr:hypothetical protein FZEAL_5875 [Fusarium zealandicum]
MAILKERFSRPCPVQSQGQQALRELKFVLEAADGSPAPYELAFRQFDDWLGSLLEDVSSISAALDSLDTVIWHIGAAEGLARASLMLNRAKWFHVLVAQGTAPWGTLEGVNQSMDLITRRVEIAPYGELEISMALLQKPPIVGMDREARRLGQGKAGSDDYDGQGDHLNRRSPYGDRELLGSESLLGQPLDGEPIGYESPPAELPYRGSSVLLRFDDGPVYDEPSLLAEPCVEYKPLLDVELLPAELLLDGEFPLHDEAPLDGEPLPYGLHDDDPPHDEALDEVLTQAHVPGPIDAVDAVVETIPGRPIHGAGAFLGPDLNEAIDDEAPAQVVPFQAMGAQEVLFISAGRRGLFLAVAIRVIDAVLVDRKLEGNETGEVVNDAEVAPPRAWAGSRIVI